MTIEQTLADRGGKCGDWMDQGQVSDQIISAMENTKSWQHMPGWMRQTYRMIAEKMARACTGDPLYSDNLHDIAGYATIGEERLHRHVANINQAALPLDPVMPEIQEFARQQALIRCMGGSHCKHTPGTCTAYYSYSGRASIGTGARQCQLGVVEGGNCFECGGLVRALPSELDPSDGA